MSTDIEAQSITGIQGNPLTTCSGINIGTLFVVDDQVRNGLTADQKVFLEQMARNVMQRLEEFREIKERRREIEMNKGLAAFVDGTVNLPLDNSRTQSSNSPNDRSGRGYGISRGQDRAIGNLPNSSDASSISFQQRASALSSSSSPAGLHGDDGSIDIPNDSTAKDNVNSRNTSGTDTPSHANKDNVSQADG